MNGRNPDHQRLALSGLSAEDQRWLAGLEWKPENIPPIADEAERAAYERREAALGAAVAHLTFAERGASLEGRLAAMLGARLADWRERADEEEE